MRSPIFRRLHYIKRVLTCSAVVKFVVLDLHHYGDGNYYEGTGGGDFVVDCAGPVVFAEADDGQCQDAYNGVEVAEFAAFANRYCLGLGGIFFAPESSFDVSCSEDRIDSVYGYNAQDAPMDGAVSCGSFGNF